MNDVQIQIQIQIQKNSNETLEVVIKTKRVSFYDFTLNDDSLEVKIQKIYDIIIGSRTFPEEIIEIKERIAKAIKWVQNIAIFCKYKKNKLYISEINKVKFDYEQDFEKSKEKYGE